jgi:hypothetical protein
VTLVLKEQLDCKDLLALRVIPDQRVTRATQEHKVQQELLMVLHRKQYA